MSPPVLCRVLEGLDVQLVENGVLVPQRVGAQRGAPCLWLSVSDFRSAPVGGATYLRALDCVAGPARRPSRLQEVRRGWGQGGESVDKVTRSSHCYFIWFTTFRIRSSGIARLSNPERHSYIS
jgi:hypothetical protein